jgi:hypothetical protein
VNFTFSQAAVGTYSVTSNLYDTQGAYTPWGTVGSITVTALPAITGISPSTGSQTTQVTISGANFGTTQGTVAFGSTPASSIVSWAPNQIVAYPPFGTGTVEVIVTVPGFAPVASSSSFVETQSSYTISGTVTLGGNPPTALAGVMMTLTNQAGAAVAAPLTAANGTYMIAAQPPGTYALTPSLTGYVFASQQINLTANQTQVNASPSPPAITGFSLGSGPSLMGFVINGTSFGPSQGTSTVTFNGQQIVGPGSAASAWGTDGKSITVQVPQTAQKTAYAAGTYPVVVNVGNLPSAPMNFQVTVAFGCNFNGN